MKISLAIALTALLLACDPDDNSGDISGGGGSSSKAKKPKPPVVQNLNITDPLYKDQWYLKNTKTAGADINIEAAWKRGYTGQGIKIGILDDFVDSTHPDLKDNIPAKNSIDYFPNLKNDCRYHGTRVAGIIAARDNHIGIRGIAPRATLYGYGVLKNGMDHSIVSQAFKRDMKEIAVYNNSWSEGGKSIVFLPDETMKTIDQGLKEGFYGKGTSFVAAGGNETIHSTISSEFSGHYGVIIVESVSTDGTVAKLPAFIDMNRSYGPNIWVSTFSPDILTTDVYDPELKKICNSTKNYAPFGGSSAAAPQVAGVIALIREANPNLNWRDIKVILAESANPKLAMLNGKSTYQKAARRYTDPTKFYEHSFYAGFGVLDAGKAIDLALRWKSITQPLQVIKGSQNDPFSVSQAKQFFSSDLTITEEINFVEAVTLEIEFLEKPPSLNSFEMELVSPDNIVSKLVIYHQFLRWKKEWKIRTVPSIFLGVSQIKGAWQLRMKKQSQDASLKIKNWKLTIRGH